jgi:methionyl-tRNA synthetase
MRRATFGADLKFSELDLKRMNNKEVCVCACWVGSHKAPSHSHLHRCFPSQLADVLGNLAHRSTNLIVKYCDGVIPAAHCSDEPFDLVATVAQTEKCFVEYRLQDAADIALDCTRRLNEYITEKEPWKLHKQLDMAVPENVRHRDAIVRTLAEALYVVAHFLEPFMPTTAAKIFEKLGTPPRYIRDLEPGFEHLAPGATVTHGEILFDKFEITQGELAAEKEELALLAAEKAESAQ